MMNPHGFSGRLINVGPDIARDWISDPDIAKEVEKRLAEYKLDGSVVIADAIQAASYKLELIEALIVSAEKRRDTANIAANWASSFAGPAIA
jgi:hypothetical protein